MQMCIVQQAYAMKAMVRLAIAEAPLDAANTCTDLARTRDAVNRANGRREIKRLRRGRSSSPGR
jgi:hypothetical protein